MFFVKTPAGVFPLIPVGDSINMVEFFGKIYVIDKMAMYPLEKGGFLGDRVPFEVFALATPKACPNVYTQRQAPKTPKVVINEGGYKFGGVTVKVVLRD